MDDGYDIGFAKSDDQDVWGGSSAPQQDDLSVALEKEKIIKDMMSTQEGLKALLGRVDEVTEDIKKLSDENAMLQVYLDNMTRNTAIFASGKDSKR